MNDGQGAIFEGHVAWRYFGIDQVDGPRIVRAKDVDSSAVAGRSMFLVERSTREGHYHTQLRMRTTQEGGCHVNLLDIRVNDMTVKADTFEASGQGREAAWPLWLADDHAGGYRPFQPGSRLARNASIPSALSSVVVRIAPYVASRASPSSSGIFRPS